MLALMLNKFKSFFTLDPRPVDWPRCIVLVIATLAVCSALWQCAMPQVKVITQNQFHPVPVIKETTKIQRVQVACPAAGIITLDKAEVAKQLDIDFLQGGDIVGATHASPASPEGSTPSLVKGRAGEGLQVTTTADLPESDNGIDVVALMNMETGETQLVAREKEAPWWQFRNDGAVGVKYGINQHLTPISDVYGKWDFLRLKNVYLGVSGTISTDGDAKLQLGAEYRW